MAARAGNWINGGSLKMNKKLQSGRLFAVAPSLIQILIEFNWLDAFQVIRYRYSNYSPFINKRTECS